MSGMLPLLVTHPAHVAFEAHWKELGPNEKKVRDKLFDHVIFSDIPQVCRQRLMQLYAMCLVVSQILTTPFPAPARQIVLYGSRSNGEKPSVDQHQDVY